MARLIKYKNATTVKDKNRRVTAFSEGTERVIIELKHKPDDLEDLKGTGSIEEILKGKVRCTTIGLSITAAHMLWMALASELGLAYDKETYVKVMDDFNDEVGKKLFVKVAVAIEPNENKD